MRRACERCGRPYEGYMVLVRDNFSDIVEFQSCEWDHLCKPCRMAVGGSNNAFLTPEEKNTLEPREELTARDKVRVALQKKVGSLSE